MNTMETKKRRRNLLYRRIRVKINVLYYEEVVIVFAVTIGKWAIARNCSALAG